MFTVKVFPSFSEYRTLLLATATDVAESVIGMLPVEDIMKPMQDSVFTSDVIIAFSSDSISRTAKDEERCLAEEACKLELKLELYVEGWRELRPRAFQIGI